MLIPSCLSPAVVRSAQDPNAVLQLLPFLIAIGLAVILRNATVALALALISAHIVASLSCNPAQILTEAITGPMRDIGHVLKSTDVYTLIFVTTMAVLANELAASGDIDQLVAWINRKRAMSKQKVGISAVLLGLFVFVESSLSCMIVGLTFRRLRKDVGMSAEKFSYICDSMSSPVAMLFPINGWGAFVMTQIASVGFTNPLSILVKQTRYAYYPLFAVTLCAIAAMFDWNIFGMKKAERRITTRGISSDLRNGPARGPAIKRGIELYPSTPDTLKTKSAHIPIPWSFILTIISLLAINIILLAASGYYNTVQGHTAKQELTHINLWTILGAADGALSVLVSVLSVFGTRALLRWILSPARSTAVLSKDILRSVREIAPVIILMILAFAFGRVSRDLLRIDEVILSFVNGQVDPRYFAAIIFIAGAVLSFSTGTSWGTFAILIPIAMPLARPMLIQPETVLAAILGGGVFGDQSSPISDTTILSSIMCECDHTAHVRTQLPYVLLAAGATIIAYIIIR